MPKKIKSPLQSLGGIRKRIATWAGKFISDQAILNNKECACITQSITTADKKKFNEYYMRLLNSAPFSCNFWDENFNLVASNDENCRLFDIPNNDVFHNNFAAFSPEYQPDGMRSVEKAMKILREAGEKGFLQQEWMHCKENGELIPAEVTLVAIDMDDKKYVGAYVRDLRHIKNLEENVRQQNDELREQSELLKVANEVAKMLLFSTDEQDFDKVLVKIFNLLGTAVFADRVYVWRNSIGPDNRLYCSQVYEWVDGVFPMGRDAITQDVSYDDVLPGWMENFRSGNGVNALVSDLSAENDLLQVQGIVSLLVMPIIFDDVVWGFIGFDDCKTGRKWTSSHEYLLKTSGMLIATSIKKHKISEDLHQAKEQAEQAALAKSEFLARMSHEIRTPMNAVLGMCYLCLQTELSPVQYSYITKAQTAAKNLLGILNDILDFSKIEARKIELESVRFSIVDVIKNAIDVIFLRAEEKDLDLSYKIGTDVPKYLMGDALRINQIILNLLGNAVKFTEKGHILLEVNCAECCEQTAKLKFTVKDTGIGLSSDEQARLFMPFMQSDVSITRRFGGTGLGLVICKELVEMMHGNIELESVKGQGSVFTVNLTFAIANDEKQEQVSDRRERSLDQLKGKKVLLVEDNDINQLIATSLLEQAQMVVSVASNGIEAVESVKKENFELILMDIQMPLMDGFEATVLIRTMHGMENVPIIAMTAHAMSTDRDKSLAVGMNDYISKPVDPQYLFNMLLKWLG